MRALLLPRNAEHPVGLLLLLLLLRLFRGLPRGDLGLLLLLLRVVR